MDNKITKQRFSAFMHYEWIKIVALIACVCFLWRLLFIQLGSKERLLTNGQQFYFYYSPEIISDCPTNMNNLLNDKNVLSYDIQYSSVYQFDATYGAEQLNGWLIIGDGDMIITSDVPDTPDGDVYSSSNFRSMVDKYNVYDLDELMADAENYASQFKLNQANGFVASNINYDTIKTKFLERSKNDKRFKTNSQKEDGVKLENQRIERLFVEINDFKKLLEKDIFVNYKSGAKGDEVAKKYGIDLSKLVGSTGKTDITTYASLSVGENGDPTAKYTVLAVFDFLHDQPELQFETISVINALVRATTTLLD